MQKRRAVWSMRSYENDPMPTRIFDFEARNDVRYSKLDWSRRSH